MDQKKKKYRMLLMQLSCAVLLASDAAAWASVSYTHLTLPTKA